MTNVETLEEALEKLGIRFPPLRSNELIYFFLYKNAKKNRFLGFSLSRIPNFKYKIQKFPNVIRFNMDWSGMREIEKQITDKTLNKAGWDNVETKQEIFKKSKYNLLKQNNKFDTKMIMDLHNPCRVQCYEWGFEISTHGPVDLVGIKNHFVDSNKFNYLSNDNEIIGKSWTLPLIEENLRLVWEWDKDKDYVDIDDILGEEKDIDHRAVDMGQRRLDIDIDGE